MGETLSLRGHHLAGNQTRARFRILRGTATLESLAAADANEAGFDVQMAPDPNWQAGIYEVTALMEQGGILRETNRLPLVLAPRLDLITPNITGGELTSLQVDRTPAVRPNQSVVLLVGDRELLPDAFTAPAGTLTFQAPAALNALPSGQQPVRLRVDGIESLVVDYQATPPQFQPSQSVAIP